jgi:hypothetical protein
MTERRIFFSNIHNLLNNLNLPTINRVSKQLSVRLVMVARNNWNN